MPVNTSNALTDFDLCLALAQKAINSQMTYAWRAWKRRSNFQDTIRIFKTRKGGAVVDAKTGLEATIAPLTVSLNVPDGKLGQVRVTLGLTSGTVTYIDDETGELTPYRFKDWAVSFITDLDKKPVDLDTLRRIDPDTHQTARKVIEESGLPDALFSIEYLFMKFTDVDLMLADNKDVRIPADVPGAARDRALSSLNFLLQGDLGEFMLGTVVRRNNKQATPTFAMTDFIFDVHPNPKAPAASTLAYLGMFSNRALPADRNAARLKLPDGWVSPGQLDGTQGLVSGVMVIRKGVFMDQYLIPEFARVIGRQPIAGGYEGAGASLLGKSAHPDPLKWGFLDADSQTSSSKDLIKREYDWGRGYALDIAVVPGSNRLSITGKVFSHATYDGYTLGANWHTEWIHYSGSQPLSGTVSLNGSGVGTGFQLTPALSYEFGDVQVGQSEVGGFATVSEAAGWLGKKLDIMGETPAELLGNQQRRDVENLRSWLDRALRNVTVSLNQHAFIPPGGGVFTFQNPTFSNAGDLFLEVIYQAP